MILHSGFLRVAEGRRDLSVFRRYTHVLSLLDMVHHERLTLLSPRQWYDQNDSFGLELYGQRHGGVSIYALCLAEAPEHAHHWQIFANHTHGLCVQFHREALLEHLGGFADHVLHGPVEYMNLKKIRALEPILTERLPFLKRDTFKSEDEYRILAWQKADARTEALTLPLPLELISKVVFGPSMPRALADTLRDQIKLKPATHHIQFSISRLSNNESWRDAILDGIGE